MPHTQMTRFPEKGTTNRAQLDALLDEVPLVDRLNPGRNAEVRPSHGQGARRHLGAVTVPWRVC